MGGVCSSVSSFVSVALDALERISLCTVCAALVCCILFTILSVMVMGVGIGYHYCFVQNSVEAMAKAAAAAGALREGPESRRGNVMRSVDKAVHRGFAHRMSRREADSPQANNNLTLTKNFTDTNDNYNLTDTNNMYNLTDTKKIYNITETHNIYNFAEPDTINNFTDNNRTVINSRPQLNFRTLTTMNFTVF